MKIAYIGKFRRLHDEEYIARSFETIGHEVIRIPENHIVPEMIDIIERHMPDIVLFAKLVVPNADVLLNYLKSKQIKTVSWTFDLYWDYQREERIQKLPGFKADYVFTTDDGHDEKWKLVGINHKCVRQGIYKEECILLPIQKREYELVFVGSDNPYNTERNHILKSLVGRYKLSWFGRNNSNELRGMDLNELYSKSAIIIGDSVYSPHYWSNRVVETLGRGGFLIHQEVEGLKEEYPYLVTYKRGDLDDLKEKIDYYLTHEDERLEIVRKNFEWVRNNYTCDKKCAKIIENI